MFQLVVISTLQRVQLFELHVVKQVEMTLCVVDSLINSIKLPCFEK